MRNHLSDAFDQYILNNQSHFYRTAYYYIPDRDTSLDIVQNAILKALENASSLRNPAAIKTWFYRILTNECLKELNHRKREVVKETSELEEESYTDQFYDGENESLHHAIQKLSDAQKSVIMLHYFEEFTLKEVAEITGTNLNTVKSRLYSALEKLKINLEGKQQEKFTGVQQGCRNGEKL